MLPDLGLFVLNVLLCVIILYSILQPKPLQRGVRDRIEELRERWKGHRRLHPKCPDDCARCRSETEVEVSRRPLPIA